MLLCAATRGSGWYCYNKKEIGIETRTLVGNYPAIKTQSLRASLARCSLHDAEFNRVGAR